MSIKFEDAFIDIDHDRNLDLEFLRKNKFASRPIITVIRPNDLHYFDSVGGKKSKSYKLHHAEWMKPEKVEELGTIDDLYSYYIDFNHEDVIIEFYGKNLFIWTEEVDYYVIFGDRSLIEAINIEKYSIDNSLDFVKNKNDNHEKEFFENFIKKYNVSF